MSANRNQRGLMVEIMIAVLFFALCATILLETFVAACDYSRRVGVDSAAIVEMQNLAEQIYAAGDVEEMLADAGFELSGSTWQREDDGCRMVVYAGEEAMPAGTLRTARLCAYMGERLIAEIPAERYFPGEVAE